MVLHNEELNAVDFEQIVLQQYRKIYKKNEKWTKILNYKNSNTNAATGISPLYREREAKCCGSGNWWWEPPRNSIPADFCTETSIHGLLFVSQPKRHLCERVFWAIIFVISFAASIVLINDVWSRYHQNPVIVTFQPKETDIDELPFPAVTICNMNAFPRSAVEKRLKIIEAANRGEGISKDELYIAKEEIKMINAICSGVKSFAKSFGFAENRGKIDRNLTTGHLDDDSRAGMTNFLLDNTLPCDQLIRFCVWSEAVFNCSDLFKSVASDYGKCCTFNMLPEVLMFHVKLRRQDLKRPQIPYVARWNKSETELWGKWHYSDNYVLQKNVKRPWRQYRAGLRHGLSILVDPNVDDNFCSLSDSEGFRIQLHTPLEFPHVEDFGTIIGLQQEIYMEVHPDLTVSHSDIKEYKIEDRKCFTGNEQPAEFYFPYTSVNCVDSCVSKLLIQNCNCTEYYMPKNNDTKTCDLNGDDSKCVSDTKDNIHNSCDSCLPLCEDLSYNFEVTSSELHKGSSLWGDNKNNSNPDWMNHKMTILHIYFGAESTVPKIRRKLYEITDLIANTGGLLGLCLGVSVLSLVEVLYFSTLRAFWQYKRKKEVVKKLGSKFLGYIWKPKDKLKNTNPIKRDLKVFQFQPSNFYLHKPTY